MESLTLPAAAVADLLGITVARVGQLAKDGVITRHEDGTYPPSAITQYVEWIKRPSGGKNKNYKELIDKEKHREIKRENDIADGKVAPLTILHDALTEIGTKIKAQMEALPLEMKRANPRLTGHDIMIVKKSIARCCNAISETKIQR
jgi:phage terminase Nu1 subunit (DNA packaging protein)